MVATDLKDEQLEQIKQIIKYLDLFCDNPKKTRQTHLMEHRIIIEGRCQ